jgi:alkylhydroperoxidase family enzyme
MLGAWRGSDLYSARERAALALSEAITLIGQGHVPDEVRERARAEFDKFELGELVSRSPPSTPGTAS